VSRLLLLLLLGLASAAPAQPSPAIPPAFFVAHVRDAAKQLGDPHPTGAVWTTSTRAAANAVLLGTTIMKGGSEPVYVAVITGKFRCVFCSVPPGASIPTGSVASFVDSARTGQGLDFSIGGTQQPDLARLGPAGDLLPYLTGRSTPLCSPLDLAATAFLQGETGSLVGELTVRSRARVACLLPPRPVISVDTGTRRVLPQPIAFPPGLRQGAPIRLLRPGRSARAGIWWTNWCAEPREPPVLQVVLPGTRGVLRVRVLGYPRCDQPRRPTELAIGPWVRP
jgi:hypothetical protein